MRHRVDEMPSRPKLKTALSAEQQAALVKAVRSTGLTSNPKCRYIYRPCRGVAVVQRNNAIACAVEIGDLEIRVKPRGGHTWHSGNLVFDLSTQCGHIFGEHPLLAKAAITAVDYARDATTQRTLHRDRLPSDLDN